ncbi:MAG TPA: PTS sugar transporter subunit IIA [Candidatus Brocadiia bacterium]|nr:PTS sugar transporter subunit IIA [Candidatus Brocadiia bacterium]
MPMEVQPLQHGGATDKLSALFDERHIICGIDTEDHDECIRRLVNVIHSTGHLSGDPAETTQAVLNREELVCTEIAPGLAIPHARVDAVTQVRVAVATSPKGVIFDANGMGPARVVVLILTPKLAAGDYLQALAAVARCFSQPEAAQRVAAMTTAAEVWRFFDSGGALPKYVSARDMMRTNVPTLRYADPIRRAIDIFCQEPGIVLPVLDADGDLVGMLSEKDLLRIALPEYIAWLDDLSPIIHFEPFAQILKDEEATRVAEVLDTSVPTVPENAPAILVARELLARHARQIMVVREKKLLGVITLSDFLARVLRG